MATTYTLIDKTTLTGTQAAIEFTSIDQSYKDLKLVISGRTTRTGSDIGDEIYVQFGNGTIDTGNNYATLMVEGDGSATRSVVYSSQSKLIYSVVPTDDATSNTFSNVEYYIPNYTNTSNSKSVSFDAVMENNATLSYMYLCAGLWSASPVAINRIKITAIGSYVQHSSFYLYGIKNS